MCNVADERDDCAVRIAVRERPLHFEVEAGGSIVSYHERSANILVVDERPFTFDHVWRPATTQQQIFDELIKPLVIKVKQGFNCTVLAYGQTGTGKSYTMGMNCNAFEDENVGIIPRCLKEILSCSADEENSTAPAVKHYISASFIEIYNEKVYDLLAENSTEPIIARGYKFTGGTRKPLINTKECYSLLLQGQKNRHVRPTKMNLQSSRSHAIFTVHVRTAAGDEDIYSARLNLVDLAGSEGVRRTGHQGVAMSEGVHINQGLLSIGKVLQAMAMGNKMIPYRDSVLSTVLQDSFNVNSYLTLLACISPYRADLSETLSTLRFAQSAKQLKHTPHVNSILAELKKSKTKTPFKINTALNRGSTPFAQIRQNSGNKTSATYHSNTFCTPSKCKRLDADNKFNKTEMGLTPKEKQTAQIGIICPLMPAKTATAPSKPVPSVPAPAANTSVQLVNNRESLLDGSIDSRASLMSLNVSTSTVMDGLARPTNYSPIVRRCMAEFENVVENKMQQMMEDLKDKNAALIMQNTPYTPLPATLRQELKSIMQEVLTDNVANRQKPCADDTTDILLTSRKENAKCQLFTTSSPIFKVPAVPELKRQTTTINVDMSIDNDINCFAESFEQTMRKKSVRRSRRLTERAQLESTLDGDETMNQPLRRSQRLLSRTADLGLTIVDTTLSSSVSSCSSFVSTSPSLTSRNKGAKRKSLKQLHGERRRSVRLAAGLNATAPKLMKTQHPKTKSSSRTTVAGNLDNTVIASYFTDKGKNTTRAQKPNLTKHRKAVLELLNTGTIKELQLLPQIGPKTAYQLVTQRMLFGKFKSLAQVEKLPIWRHSWELFAQANLLL